MTATGGFAPIPLSLYVHVPWCVQKCPYCDFNSHNLRGALPENDYIAALIADLACFREPIFEQLFRAAVILL